MKRFLISIIFILCLTIGMLGCGFAMIHIQDITSYAASLKEQEVASSNTSQTNTVLAPKEDGLYTIVLDAGHGDYDTGSIVRMVLMKRILRYPYH